jgi:hypothetical protein
MHAEAATGERGLSRADFDGVAPAASAATPMSAAMMNPRPDVSLVPSDRSQHPGITSIPG